MSLLGILTLSKMIWTGQIARGPAKIKWTSLSLKHGKNLQKNSAFQTLFELGTLTDAHTLIFTPKTILKVG